MTLSASSVGGPVRVPLDESWLPLTAEWLSDPDIARLTMSGDFDAGGQRAWFDSLQGRTDYAVWGIEYDGVKVGVMGLKYIGVDDGAEYFMYIGPREYWGRGISRWAFDEIVAEARSRGLRWLYGRTAKYNERAMAVNLRHGYRIVRDDGDTWWLAYAL